MQFVLVFAGLFLAAINAASTFFNPQRIYTRSAKLMSLVGCVAALGWAILCWPTWWKDLTLDQYNNLVWHRGFLGGVFVASILSKTIGRPYQPRNPEQKPEK